MFEKILNGPNGILRDPGKTDSRKKIEVENLMSDSLNRVFNESPILEFLQHVFNLTLSLTTVGESAHTFFGGL
jgi:hypothetical protein